MKQRMKYAALALTLGLMALIFYFSGQPAAAVEKQCKCASARA